MAAESSVPRLTVRAVAEMLKMPAYEQSRILHEQKYPKQQPQSFRTPYYQRALSGVREYYRSGNDPVVLSAAQSDLQNIADVTRRSNNLRVLESFGKSLQAKRKLTPVQNKRCSAKVGSLEIRLSADLQALEKDELRIFYFNCRAVAIPDEIATMTIEIAHWVRAHSELSVDLAHIEVVDVSTGRSHRTNKGRSGTIRMLRNNARVIEALWGVV